MINQDKAELYQVGHAQCKLVPFEEKGLNDHQSGKLKWVIDLITDEQHRNQGLASNLLKQLGKEADEAQVGLLMECRGTENDMDNERLEAFYKRHGFVRIQDEPLLLMRTPVPPILLANLTKKKTANVIQNVYGQTYN